MTSNTISTMFSSARSDWSTPQAFFDRLNMEFQFDLDVCATAHNAKCASYFSEEVDGLAQEWEGRAWMNPPYGRTIGAWVAKAYASSRTGATVVCLLPARTDTTWFQDFCLRCAAEIRFVRGRLKFDGHKNSAPFPSAVVIFQPGHDGPPMVTAMQAQPRLLQAANRSSTADHNNQKAIAHE